MPKIEISFMLTSPVECRNDIWEQRRAQDPTLELEDPLIAIPPGTFFPLFSSYIYRLCNSFATIEYTDGVVYLELRTTPKAVPERNITKGDYIKTILSLIKTHNEPESSSMQAHLISIDRRNTSAEAEEVVNLAPKYRSDGVIGIDLSKAAGLKMTLHFAETQVSATDQELRALLSWQPDRLVHVIHAQDESQEVIKKRNIGLDLCLSCNAHAELITGGYPNHHFGMWRHSDVPVVLCTDDVGVFSSPLSYQYSLAATHFGFDRKQLKELCERAIDSIFAGPD
ncbi:Metallo-dependent hydrolase [Lindgomyces ingoldianus]|uniref:Metallo-dependent hydrolase n=1 Tax=Lindgomyces ingoldianus TaxID=673940 RepID=A0ACB6QGV2_9PLEO|nr:Metallo-dependent hydrolase [Lindgomyces ingoldianus]KAF2466156.1 Metallo-dependent hydrolase [Lindgomyces ingoldianus]